MSGKSSEPHGEHGNAARLDHVIVGCAARAGPLLVLVFVLVLFFLLVVVVLVVGRFVIFIRLQRRLRNGQAFRGLAFGGFQFGRLELAQALVIFPSVEQQMQPWHHLLDRRELAGRTSLAARSGFALHAGLALWTGFATWTLRTDLALRPRLAARSL
jgi:hypothetical protein